MDFKKKKKKKKKTVIYLTDLSAGFINTKNLKTIRK